MKHFLSTPQIVKLGVYLEANYRSSGLNDSDFAAQASKDLEFTVTTSNVRGLRCSYKMASNVDYKAEQNAIAKAARIANKAQKPAPKQEQEQESLRSMIERMITLVEELPQAVIAAINTATKGN